jgi:hypothetical protein
LFDAEPYRPALVVLKMLGHSKPSITLDIYGHFNNDMQYEAADIMDKLVAPIRVQLPLIAEEALKVNDR